MGFVLLVDAYKKKDTKLTAMGIQCHLLHKKGVTRSNYYMARVNAITENVQCVQALSFKCCSLGYNSIEP
jgi:hypothetical protein